MKYFGRDLKREGKGDEWAPLPDAVVAVDGGSVESSRGSALATRQGPPPRASSPSMQQPCRAPDAIQAPFPIPLSGQNSPQEQKSLA